MSGSKEGSCLHDVTRSRSLSGGLYFLAQAACQRLQSHVATFAPVLGPELLACASRSSDLRLCAPPFLSAIEFHIFKILTIRVRHGGPRGSRA